MAYMAIKGDEWAPAFDITTAPSLFPNEDALPDYAVVHNYNQESGDILIMTKNLEVALSRALNVAVHMRGDNSIVAWSFTSQTLADVLTDLRAMYDAARHPTQTRNNTLVTCYSANTRRANLHTRQNADSVSK